MIDATLRRKLETCSRVFNSANIPSTETETLGLFEITLWCGVHSPHSVEFLLDQGLIVIIDDEDSKQRSMTRKRQ